MIGSGAFLGGLFPAGRLESDVADLIAIDVRCFELHDVVTTAFASNDSTVTAYRIGIHKAQGDLNSAIGTAGKGNAYYIALRVAYRCPATS